MSYRQYLREMLRPLGVYDTEAPFVGGELDTQGDALDGVFAALEEVQREELLITAEDRGLENIARLLTRRPVAERPEQLAAALAALLRIGGDSFTLAAVNDTIRGCGIPAKVVELGAGEVEVSFPGVAGEPVGLPEMKEIIEDILPAHLGISYSFWYLTWSELEEKFPSWGTIEKRGLTWHELETCVEQMNI